MRLSMKSTWLIRLRKINRKRNFRLCKKKTLRDICKTKVPLLNKPSATVRNHSLYKKLIN